MKQRRHMGHMNPGMGGNGHNNNRRHQGKYGFQQHGGQRPRKNYAVLREKYLNQAKDAMSGGDRVLAEYYLQFADHYYRMQQEFLAERQQRYQQQAQNNEQPEEFSGDDVPGSDEPEIDIPNNSNVLPSFLTRPVPASSGGDAPPPVQNWEEE